MNDDIEGYTKLYSDKPDFASVVGDSYILYHAVYNDLYGLTTDLRDDLKFQGQDILIGFGKTFVNEKFSSDVDFKFEDWNHYEAAFSSETVSLWASRIKGLSIDSMKEAHLKLSIEGVTARGMHFELLELETDEFISYFKSLITFVENAARDGDGLVIQVG